MQQNPKRYFVTGTGTGVGKTFVTAVLNRQLQLQGKKVLVIKPAQTGAVHLPDGSRISADLRFVENYAAEPLLLSQEEACPFLYDLAASPHLAAEGNELQISIEAVLKHITMLEEKYQPEVTLIEGAGGLFVPLNKDYEMMIDLIAAIDCEAVLVASATLGTLNHSLLSVEALKTRSIAIKSLCLNGYDDSDLIARDNLATLQKLLDCEIFTLPELPLFDTESEASLTAIDLGDTAIL